MYLTGKGVLENHSKAYEWFHKSALQGNEMSQYKLGMMYGGGFFVEQDFKKSYMWIIISEYNNYDGDAELKKLIKNYMSSKSVNEAQSMAKRCLDSGYTKCD